DGQLCFVRRRDYCRTKKHDRLRRTTRDQGNNASGFAGKISDCRISRGTRLGRHDRAPKKTARGNQPIAILFRRATVSVAPRSRLNYKQALAWLYGLQRFGIKLGLENIRRLIAECCSGVCVKRPALASTLKVIHVAGTNGKGSVCAMIDSICRAQGYRTGFFLFPHLVTFCQRIRLNAAMISEEAVADGLTTIRNLVANWDPHPTFFEVVTGLALKHFSDTRVEIVILETGLGGRLDATNAIQSDVSVITPIDYDHEQWLGKTISEIAFEKAGIIKLGVPVVSASQRTEAEEVIRTHAAKCGSSLGFVTQPYDESPIALAGSNQKQNAALAIAALRAAKIDIDSSSIP